MTEPSIRCLTCGLVSYNANDVRERFCGRCHKWEADKLEPLCRYCDDFAVLCRTEGPRNTRTFRCEAHRYTEDIDATVPIHERPTYEHLDLDAELMPAMRAAWRARQRKERKR